eukprot:CAMPEP_0182527696 /NCGR_PEP_ID=MMETSP1323-20130603/4021_1 /TAXON_ID=236787 /ORGANISM="Florenciella parvula, Strain RCC1693" /LENGTH=86 /DNA_ID=CAMNT_0024736717 /DNA_START=59 /DNA_END=319 /DNA_ORIENTATION=+
MNLSSLAMTRRPASAIYQRPHLTTESRAQALASASGASRVPERALKRKVQRPGSNDESLHCPGRVITVPWLDREAQRLSWEVLCDM